MQLTFREQWMDERLKFNDYNGKYMKITLLTKSVLKQSTLRITLAHASVFKFNSEVPARHPSSRITGLIYVHIIFMYIFHTFLYFESNDSISFLIVFEIFISVT